jgi:hypothetical protein
MTGREAGRRFHVTKQEEMYGRFEALEERLAHCYFVLQERFIGDPPLAKFWADVAMEELQHAAVLRYCREHVLVTDVAIDPKLHERIDDLLDTVSNLVRNPDVTVEEAFYSSLLIESSELDEVYGKLIRVLKSDHLILYRTIKSNLRRHHDKFAEGASTFLADRAFAEAFTNVGNPNRCGVLPVHRLLFRFPAFRLPSR